MRIAVAAVNVATLAHNWWVVLLRGIAGVLFGVVTFAAPGISLAALVLLCVIAAWALVAGALEIATAVRLRKVISGEWLLVLSGIASIGLGVLLVVFPGAGALAVVLWIGAYAVVFGGLLIALAFRLRSWGTTHRSRGHQAAPATA